MNNKTVFVTGGANGIGRGIVKAFCKAGADVTFCDIDEQAALMLLQYVHEYKCEFIKCDIADKTELENAMNTVLERKGTIDVLINNAGVSRFKSILETDVEEFDKILDINLRPVFITSKILAEHRSRYKDRKYGRIINIASTRYLMSEPNSEGYAASKGGIVSLTHALAISLSPYNITVNCISPGWIETGYYPDLRPSDHSQHPSNRVGRPEDIAQTCLFLCGEGNDFINGQNIVVDGGMTKKMIYEE